jgi:divalent metal cation (Fe/Co/Zn/Cd) transporter
VPVTFVASLVAGGTGLAVGWALDATFGPPVGAFIAGTAGGIVALATLWWIDRALGLGLAEQLARAFPALRRILGTRPGPV